MFIILWKVHVSIYIPTSSELGCFEWLLFIKNYSPCIVITLKAFSWAECSCIKGWSMRALDLVRMAESRACPVICVRGYRAIRTTLLCLCFMACYILIAVFNSCGFLFLVFSWKLKRVWKQPDSYRPHKLEEAYWITQILARVAPENKKEKKNSLTG